VELHKHSLLYVIPWRHTSHLSHWVPHSTRSHSRARSLRSVTRWRAVVESSPEVGSERESYAQKRAGLSRWDSEGMALRLMVACKVHCGCCSCRLRGTSSS
jgi:hypothetical protein